MKFTKFKRIPTGYWPVATVDLPWPDFVAGITTDPPVVSDPLDRPLFGPYSLIGPRATDAAVEYVTIHCLDYDRLTHAQFGQIVERCSRWQGLIYTTWSCNDPKKSIAIRVLIPCTAVKPGPWRTERTRLINYIGILPDKATEDISHRYYGPCSKPGELPPAFLHLTGRPFEPYTIPGNRDVTPEDFAALRKYIARKSDNCGGPEKRDKIKRVRNAVDSILLGEPYAEAGDIDPTLTSLIGYMRAVFGNDVNTDSILDIMGRSLDVMPADRSHEHAREKIERFFATAREDERDAQQERCREHFERIGMSRTEPYTPEETLWMRDTYAQGARNSTLVYFRRRLFGLSLSGYQAYGATDLPDVIRALAPFPDVESVNGVVPRGAPQLLLECGQHAETLEYDYNTPAAKFVSGALLMRAAPLRPIEPRHHPDVDTLIDLICGRDAPLFREWLRWLPYTDQALAALFLFGPPGTGKSLLVKGLAKLWGAMVPMAQAFEEFNSDQLLSPLIVADEHFPKDRNGRYKTEELREILQLRTHTINAKNEPHVKLHGYVRAVLMANNKNMLRLSTVTQTKNDVGAINRRLLRITVQPEAADWLRHHADTAKLAETDAIAEHVMHLATPRPPPSPHQFAIPPQEDDYSLVVGMHNPSTICQMCIDALTVPRTGFRVANGYMHVSTKALRETWDSPRPTVPVLKDALQSISIMRVHMRKPHDGHYWRINTAALVAWNKEADYVPEEFIRTQLTKLSEVEA